MPVKVTGTEARQSSSTYGSILTRGSLRTMFAFSLISGVLLGFSAGMALDAVSGTPPYYMTRQTVMGFLAGAIAPPMALLLTRLAPRFFPDPEMRRSGTFWQGLYASAGFLTGLVCLVIYLNLPAPPFKVGLSVIIYPIAATLVFTPVASFSDTYEATYRKEQLTRDIFSRYVSGQVVDRLLSQGGPVTLSGERRTITVLFSDIRGFSRMSQDLAADDVVSTLNEYFTLMVDIVFQVGGTVDKFMGDGLMVLFGAPLAQGDEAARAARAAVMMQAAVDELNVRRAARGAAPLGIGIGLDTGEAVTGNIGSPRRLEYTAIGVVVNNASYLSKLSQSGQILVTSATQAALPPNAKGVPWRPVVMRGSDVEAQVYQVLPHPGMPGRADAQVSLGVEHNDPAQAGSNGRLG